MATYCKACDDLTTFILRRLERAEYLALAGRTKAQRLEADTLAEELLLLAQRAGITRVEIEIAVEAGRRDGRAGKPRVWL